VDDERRRELIRAKIVAIARDADRDATVLGDDDIIPKSGCLDSAGIIELLVWFEDAFGIPLAEKEINVENLGTVARMARFAAERAARGN
jgi:acyl carrier protein